MVLEGQLIIQLACQIVEMLRKRQWFVTKMPKLKLRIAKIWQLTYDSTTDNTLQKSSLLPLEYDFYNKILIIIIIIIIMQSWIATLSEA